MMAEPVAFSVVTVAAAGTEPPMTVPSIVPPLMSMVVATALAKFAAPVT